VQQQDTPFTRFGPLQIVPVGGQQLPGPLDSRYVVAGFSSGGRRDAAAADVPMPGVCLAETALLLVRAV
jgi:hypothetical protein